MPNPKKYDRVEVLDKAIEVFRAQGYNGTSTADLATELGINRKSMYAEFGSKQGLFEAALERYQAYHLTRVLAVVSEPRAGIEQIRDAFRSYALAGESRFRGLGCLMCNSAVERGSQDPATGRQVATYIDRFTTTFRNALRNSAEAGEIATSPDLDDFAHFLTTCMIGMSASIRAETPPEQLWATYRTVVRAIDCLRLDPSRRP